VTAKPREPRAPGWERDIPDRLLRDDIAVCVDGDPARRLTSAAELAERLETLEQRRAEIAEKKRLAADAEARVEAEAAAALAKDRAARLRRLTLAFALLSLLAMAGGILAWSYQRRAARDQGRAEEARSRAGGGGAGVKPLGCLEEEAGAGRSPARRSRR